MGKRIYIQPKDEADEVILLLQKTERKIINTRKRLEKKYGVSIDRLPDEKKDYIS